MPKRWSSCSISAVVVLAATPSLCLQQPSSHPYLLASGAPQGVYFPLAQEIARAGRKAGIEIQVMPSEGSRQNLTWLAEGRADLALAQSDTAFDAYHGRGSFLHPMQDIRAIAPLYTEAVHILIRRPLFVRRVEDLQGKRISVGPHGSGSEANATEVLEAAGLTLGQVAARRLTVEETLAGLRSGDLDAAFLTSGVPSNAITGVLADGTASLLEPDLDLLERLRDACPFFLNKNIEQSDYPRLPEQVTTIGVKALLLGRSRLDESTVDRLTRALAEDRALARKYHLPDVDQAAQGVPIPFFEVAQRFYAFAALSHRWRAALGLLLAVAVVLAGYRFRRPLWRFLRRGEFLRVGIYFAAVWLGGSIALYWTEHRINDNYSSLWRSMWSGLITIYSLSSKEPLTVEGRVIAVFIFLLGLAGLLWLANRIASIYLEKKILPLLRGGLSRMHRLKDHYVLIGWSPKGPGIIAQLHGEDLDDHKLIVVLTDQVEAREIHAPGPVEVERGDPTSEEVLRRIGVPAAHSIILLADSEDPAMDARTILTILAIRKVCSEHQPVRHVPVIAEIVDPTHVSLATYAGIEGDGTLEVVSSAELGQRLLTQAAVHPGLSNLYRKLLTFEKYNSEIHRAPIPKEYAGKTFSDLVGEAAMHRSRGVDVIPIAIQRGHELFVNPAPKDLPHLNDGDILFALCDSPRDLLKVYRAEASD